MNPTLVEGGFANCFGSQTNTGGLRMCFHAEGERLVSRVVLGAAFESHPGIIHGGLVATILDEAMARCLLAVSDGRPATTLGLRVRYAQAMAADMPHRVQAEVESIDGELARVSGRLSTAEGALVAAAEAPFMLRTKESLEKAKLPAATVEGLTRFIEQRTRPAIN